MEHADLLARTRRRGVNPLAYWLVRGILQPFFLVYFRMSRMGREHIPAEGPVILASNHRSFLDPFIIATIVRRPIYFVAKKELFFHPAVSWLLSSLGAFPIDRGASDHDAMGTARGILERGDVVLIFPEGTRIRPGGLATPRRGVGRLALETGAPVVPLAIIGTEAVRRGWRIRPRKVRVRAGAPLRFQRVEAPSPQLARGVTERIWPCVMLEWEWLGGTPPIRRVAVVGAGSRGTGLAVALARAGLEVDLACRTSAQWEELGVPGSDRRLPGVELPDGITVCRGADLDVGDHDLVVFAVPARALPEVVAAHGVAVAERAGVLVASEGLVPPLGTLPSAYVAEHTAARAVACVGGPGFAPGTARTGAALVAASADRRYARQVADLLHRAGLSADTSDDVRGVELAGAARNAAALAAATAAPAGADAAGAAAGRVFAEVDAYARSHGTHAGTFHDIEPALGHAEEGRDALPLLARALSDGGMEAPALTGLADVVEGRRDPDDWASEVTTLPRGLGFVRAA